MNENDKYKKVKLNSQKISNNFIDSLSKTKFEQLKEISQKTKIKINNKLYRNRHSHLLNSELPQKKSNNKLKNYLSNTKTDYSKYNKVPHRSKKVSNFNLDNNSELFLERPSDIQNHNYNIKKDYNNFFLDYENFNYKTTITNNNSSKKYIKEKDSNIMINKILQNKLQKNTSKTKNEKSKPKIHIQLNEKKISLIKNIRNTKIANNNKNENELLEKYLLLHNEYKNNDNSKILYVIDDEQNNIYQNINIYKKYSNRNDYDLIINNQNNKRINTVCFELLKLNERKWIEELDDISNFIANNREIMDDNIYNNYIRQLVKINEHFNWLVNIIAKYFNAIFYENNNDNSDINYIDLPKYENIWFQGFKWKGLFIRAVPQDKSKYVINEVKSLNYFFLDYIQIIEGYKNFQTNKNPISNYIIFPLISYCKVKSFVLYASTLINYEQNLMFRKSELNEIENIIKENKGYIQLYSKINDSSYYLNINESSEPRFINDNYNILFTHFMEKYYDVKDISASRLFNIINIHHFIQIQKEKFLILNVAEFIPKLFELTTNSIIKMNIFSVTKDSKVDCSLKYELNTKKVISNNIQNSIIQNIWKKKSNSTIKKKDVVLCGIHFRILYESQHINNKNFKSKNFVDYLFNYEKTNIKNNNSFSIFKYESYINEPYLILYDLIEPLKIKYSLVKNKFNNYKYKNLKINKETSESFYLKSNYFSFFTNYCKMINDNTDIISYFSLKQNMKHYGIDTNLRHLILVIINNRNVRDIIKISLLVKAIKYVLNKKESEKILNNINQKGSNIYSSKSSLINNSFAEKRKETILNAIQSILYPTEILKNNKTFFEIFFQYLLFFIKIMLIKFRLINEYMSLNESYNINTLYSSPKSFLKRIIKCARKKPFLFIKELQFKLNFILNPYILFKSSISLESMKNTLEKRHIFLNDNNIFSYINNEEISGLTLAKLIHKSESLEKKIDEKNFANKSIKLGDKFNKDTKVNLYYLNSYNYYDNESHNSTYDSRKNNAVNYDNTSLLTSKFNISDSFTKIPKIKEDYDILYDNNYLSGIINLLKDFIIQVYPNCYKMIYNYDNIEESSIIFDKNRNIKDYYIYKNLQPYYKLSDVKIIYDWFEYNENIFSNIISFNGNIQHLLIKIYIFRFIITFFIEQSLEKSRIIISKIKQIFTNGLGYIISLTDLGIINLFEGLINDKNDNLDIKEKESFYSKSLIMFLMTFGEPRGRKNDSNEILLLPIWKIMNKVYEVEKDSLIYDYFKEMFLSLDYTIKNNYKFNNKNDYIEHTSFNYETKVDNINIDNKSKISLDSLNNGINNNNYIKENNNKEDNLNFISSSIFKSNILKEEYLKYFSFPLIDKNNSVDKHNCNHSHENILFSNEFILHFIYLINNLMTNEQSIILDEEYIKENIIDDLLIQSIEIKENKLKNNYNLELFKKSSSQKGLCIIKTETKENRTEKKTIYKNNSEKCIKRTNSGLYNNFSHFLYREILQKLSYKLNAPSGVILSFGNNSHYETGLDDTNVITTPHIIYKLKNKVIKNICAGWEHNIIITKKGKVFSFGHNQCYQCGSPNLEGKESIMEPKNISKNNQNLKAIAASCGNEHSLILSNEHTVYSFGSNEDGILGVNLDSDLNKELNNTTEKKKLKSYKLNKIDFGEYTNKIIEISCGTVHNLALTYDGKIFSWGSSQGGQLGLSLNELESYPGFKKNYYIQSPILIPFTNNIDTNIIKISCGEAHSLALSSEGKVYCWGFCSNGQLGLGFCEDSFEPGEGLKNSMRYKPEIIEALFEDTISDIKCGKTFSMFIDNKEELYACGVNDLYQLGIQESPPKDHLFHKEEDTCYDFILPTKVDYFLKMKVKKISCGEGHCLAVISDILSNTETIWSWGNNKFGQLGQNIFIKKSLPRPINCLFEYNFFKFDEIACGGFHSLCLIKHHKNTNWIEDDYEKIICTLIDDIGIN